MFYKKSQFVNLILTKIKTTTNKIKLKRNLCTKMYMFGQRENTTTWMNYLVRDQLDNRNVLSVHTVDGSHDQGITVLDSACWNNMVSFFQTIQVVNEITIDSQNPTLKTLPAPVKVIAYLNVL